MVVETGSDDKVNAGDVQPRAPGPRGGGVAATATLALAGYAAQADRAISLRAAVVASPGNALVRHCSRSYPARPGRPVLEAGRVSPYTPAQWQTHLGR
jgi:hypothetical protein